MNKAIIFHGTGETPNSFWYPWLATQLRGRGYTVEVPHYPDINQMPVADFLPQVLQNHTFDDNTILIGHSAGGPLILSLLERIDAVIPQAILVAGFSTESNHEPENPILQDHYD